MRIFNRLVLLVLLVTPSASTQAADLNGAWTVDASACGEVFTKENNKLAFKPDADLHAGGLIVEGKQITGTFQKCTVKSSHDDGLECASDCVVLRWCLGFRRSIRRENLRRE